MVRILVSLTGPEGPPLKYWKRRGVQRLEIQQQHNLLGDPANDEGVPAEVILLLDKQYLLPTHIICDGKFYLLSIFSSSSRVHFTKFTQ